MPRTFQVHVRGELGVGKGALPSAEEHIANGWADAVAFGQPFIANPDLPGPEPTPPPRLAGCDIPAFLEATCLQGTGVCSGVDDPLLHAQPPPSDLL